jgi:hypothetical protein
MEKFWNLADGFRRRNAALSPVEAVWVEEENKIDEDVLKVRDLRHLCWQRMHVDAQKLENLRAWEKQRQERQEREEQRRKERQERHDRHAREREHQRQQYSHQQQGYRQARGAGHGYYTDSGPRGGRPHYDRNPPYSRADGTGKKEKAFSDDMALLKAWGSYQLRWQTLGQSNSFSTPLAYTSIPWPVASEPYYPSTLTPERMAAFLLSSLHSAGKSGMDRLREAMKLWHPDKFEGRFMTFVAVSDRAVVREGLGMVARGLIELMRLQKKLSS